MHRFTFQGWKAERKPDRFSTRDERYKMIMVTLHSFDERILRACFIIGCLLLLIPDVLMLELLRGICIMTFGY
jgi:hypothetical protein